MTPRITFLGRAATPSPAGNPRTPGSNAKDEGRALGGLNNAQLPGPGETLVAKALALAAGSRAGEPERFAVASYAGDGRTLLGLTNADAMDRQTADHELSWWARAVPGRRFVLCRLVPVEIAGTGE